MPRSKHAAALTATRHGTHGPFAEVARIMTALVDVIQTGANYNALNATQKMALKETFHKSARIVSGDPMHRDHWDDIGGYAHLGAEACEAAAPAKRKYTRRAAKKAAAKPKRAAKKAVKPKRTKKTAKKKVTARPSVARRVRANQPQRVARPRRQRSETVTQAQMATGAA